MSWFLAIMDQLNEFPLLSGNNISSSELENSKVVNESIVSKDGDEFLALLFEFVSNEQKEMPLSLFVQKPTLFVQKTTLVIEDENSNSFQNKDEMSELLDRINGSNQLLSRNMGDKKNSLQSEEQPLQGSIITHGKNTRLPINNPPVLNNEQSKTSLMPLSQTMNESQISSIVNSSTNPHFISSNEAHSFNENEFIHQLTTGIDSQTANSSRKSEWLQLNTLSSSQREFASDALLERVNIMLAKNFKQADIFLEPFELGRLQIKLAVNQDMASVQFTVTNQVVKEIIEQSFPKLKEMLQQHGLQIAQSSVQQETNTHHNFFGKQMQQSSNQHKNFHSQMREQQAENEDEVTNLSLNLHQPQNGIDYYA